MTQLTQMISATAGAMQVGEALRPCLCHLWIKIFGGAGAASWLVCS
jgi:hypothetical protein